MPKSKRNKTVDLSKTKKHGLEGKKELREKIQSNVENYTHVFVFAVNDMRNSKMKNVREQWKHSRFCIGKNKVMAMALGRTPEEEYRQNLHKIGQMLIGERGLLFTNQSIDEVTKWFQSYSEGDYARSGNIATENVILPEGPLPQFPHNLESYLRQLGLPTTLKKGVIHLVKEHVVCTEGDRLSPETARILKLLGYEMAEFRIKILSVWSKDGSFINLQSDSCDPAFKENVASAPKSFMKEDFELANDCLLLGDGDDEMEVAEDNSESMNKISNNSEKDREDPEEGTEVLDVKSQTPKGKKGRNSNKSEKQTEDLEEGIEVLNVVKTQTPKGRNSKSSEKQKEEPEEGIEVLDAKTQTPKGKKSSLGTEDNSGGGGSAENEIASENLEEKEELTKSKKSKAKSANKGKQIVSDETSENKTNSEAKTSDKSESDIKNSSPAKQLDTEDVEMEVDESLEPEVKKPKNDSTIKSGRKTKKTVNKQFAKEEEQTNEVPSKEIIDSATILKLTEKKLEESAEKPKKFSPKLTRARAKATNKKVKTPEPIETKRSTRKRKM